MLLAAHLGIGLDDMFQYDMLARSLASGNGFRWYAPEDAQTLAPLLGLKVEQMGLDPRGMLTTFRAPLYPAFLALVYAVFGMGPDRFFAVRVMQAGLGAALAPMTYACGLRLLKGEDWKPETAERASRGAAWIVAGYPMLIVFPLALATENLFFPLLLAAFIVLLSLAGMEGEAGHAIVDQPHASRRAVLAGLLLGLTALTRSLILPFAVAAVLWLWLGLHQRRAAILATLALACTITPWIIRNSLVAGRPTGIETSMGYNLYVGYHPQSTGTFVFGPPSLDLLRILDDQAREQAGIRGALDFIRADPGRFPYLALRRLGHFFDLEWRAFMYFYTNGVLGHLPTAAVVPVLFLLAAPFMILAVLALAGVVVLPPGAPHILLLLLFGLYLLPHVFILSEERFHLALIPFFAVLAAAAWTQRSALLKASRPASTLILAAEVVLVVNWVFEVSRLWPTFVKLIGPDGSSLHLPY